MRRISPSHFRRTIRIIFSSSRKWRRSTTHWSKCRLQSEYSVEFPKVLFTFEGSGWLDSGFCLFLSLLQRACVVFEHSKRKNRRIRTFPTFFRRNCYLDHEKPLKVFAKYTTKNCKRECLAEFVFKQCGCVAFYHVADNSTRLCAFQEKSCHESASREFLENLEHEAKFGCLPACTQLDYDIEFRKSHFVRLVREV